MKRIHFLLLSVLFPVIPLTAQATPTISGAGGWLESAYVEWTPVAGAESYKVYYTGAGLAEQPIDNELIRTYGTYYRADVPGLSAGQYTLKVVPVMEGGTEGESVVTEMLTVLAHDRSGFAFHGGRVPGAYKADGTPKTGAVIVYITEKNKNTVSMNVTGASSNPCVGLQSILDGFKKGKDTRPLIVRLVGQITDPNYMLGGDIVIENKNNEASHITFEGIGKDAVADGWGLRVKNATNIEVRNLGFINCNSGEGDNIGLQQNNTHVWVHHCDLFYGDAGSAADQVKGDGALDCKGSSFVTFSYNHFWDTGKSNLLGLSENTTAGLFVTYHHNWYDHSDSRHPRVRYYSAHVYNNYFDGVAKYGVGATLGASVFVEGNYFRNCNNPMLISMQGTDVWNAQTQTNDYNNMPTFSRENGGIIKAYNNHFDYTGAQPRFVAYGDPAAAYNIAGVISSTVDFDAFVATSRSEQVPASVKSVYGSNTYNNFDTDASLYVHNLEVEAPAAAMQNVMTYAGRVQGGDFRWTFDNAVDDPSSAVISALKSALKNYKTQLVAVQGEGASNTTGHTLTATDNTNQTVIEGASIASIVFTWGGTADDVVVTGLPASGITFVKNQTAKTVTIFGTPTSTVAYAVATTSASGTPITVSGTIIVAESGGDVSEGDMLHNFTTSGKNSAFYAITGNLSTSKGTVTYNGQILTQCLKIESSTNVKFTTTQSATLTLVFAEAGKRVLVNKQTHTSDANGIVSVNLPAGLHEITKSDVMNLFYISTVYVTTASPMFAESVQLALYPNPVGEWLSVVSDRALRRVEILSLDGRLQFHTDTPSDVIDVSRLSSGIYLVRVTTDRGFITHQIVKK